MDCSPPGSSVRGISQARILEWVAIPYSRGPPQPRDWPWVSWDSLHWVLWQCAAWEALCTGMPRLVHLALSSFVALRLLHVGTWRQPCVKRVCRALFQQRPLTSCLCPVSVILVLFQAVSWPYLIQQPVIFDITTMIRWWLRWWLDFIAIKYSLSNLKLGYIHCFLDIWYCTRV